MFSLKEFLEILKKALDIYYILAEDTGQIGDYNTYETMMSEYNIVLELCGRLEGSYNVHQVIEKIQLYMLLKEMDTNIIDAMNSVLKVYNPYLDRELEKINKEKAKVKGVKDVIRVIENNNK